MFTVELYAKIRLAVMVDRLSRREAAKRFGVHRNTITKVLSFSVPPATADRSTADSFPAEITGSQIAWHDTLRGGYCRRQLEHGSRGGCERASAAQSGLQPAKLDKDERLSSGDQWRNQELFQHAADDAGRSRNQAKANRGDTTPARGFAD
jgi:hypothetical protein